MQPSERSAEVLVVGLGAMGAAILHHLAKRGVRATGFDRWRPPHDQGSSHGESRVTRQGVGEGEAYAPLVLRSHTLWRELEAQTGATLMLACGMLTIESPNAGAVHGRPGFLDRTAAVARQFGVAHEVFDAAELTYRYPQFGLRGDERAYLEPGGGVLFPERCIAAQLGQAARLGARLLTDVEVTAVCETSRGVEVTAGGEIHVADAVVIAAGAWTPGLVGGPLHAMRLQPQALHWFRTTDPSSYAPDRFPTFLWVHGPQAADAFYGLPQMAGLPTPGVKTATEVVDAITSPEALDRAGAAMLAADMYAAHVRGRLRDVGPATHRSAACLYTTAPDGDFAIGRPSGRSRTWAVSACSGHGFKHSAALGERIAALVCGDASQPLPAAFSLARPGLRVPQRA